MRQKKKNPNNSSIVQILLDAENIVIQENNPALQGLLADITKLRTTFEQYNSLTSKVDNMFDIHKYPDKSLTFVKLQNFKSNQVIKNLSSNAVKLLFFMIQVMSNSNVIEIKQDVVKQIINLSKPTIVKCLEELELAGCITRVKNRSKSHGSIYVVNPEIARIGNQKTVDADYKKITSQTELDCFADISKPICKVVKSVVTDDDEHLIYNSIDIDN